MKTILLVLVIFLVLFTSCKTIQNSEDFRKEANYKITFGNNREILTRYYNMDYANLIIDEYVEHYFKTYLNWSPVKTNRIIISPPYIIEELKNGG